MGIRFLLLANAGTNYQLDLGRNVPQSWWSHTKLKISNGPLPLQDLRGGHTTDFEMQVTTARQARVSAD